MLPSQPHAPGVLDRQLLHRPQPGSLHNEGLASTKTESQVLKLSRKHSWLSTGGCPHLQFYCLLSLPCFPPSPEGKLFTQSRGQIG